MGGASVSSFSVHKSLKGVYFKAIHLHEDFRRLPSAIIAIDNPVHWLLQFSKFCFDVVQRVKIRSQLICALSWLAMVSERNLVCVTSFDCSVNKNK